MSQGNARAAGRRATWSIAAIAFIAGCEAGPTGNAESPGETTGDDPVVEEVEDPQVAAGTESAEEAGRPLRLLSSRERHQFELGNAVFNTVFTPATGLGPLFNNRSCAACHSAPAPGGAGIQIETHATTWSGGACEEFEDINGGSVVQDSVTPLLYRALGITREPMPPLATASGKRTTGDLFGFGLLEQIPEAAILRRADPDDRDRDGISGRPNRTAEGVLGRFGRKAQASDLEDFVIDAFVYEQGVTSVDEEEQTIVGTPLPPGVDPKADPEITDEQLEATVAFVRLLAPPVSRLTRADERGRRIFGEIGCAGCHTPAFITQSGPSQALSGRVVRPYTDLLLHDMGRNRADICKGQATPAEFRTEPLMGVRFSSVDLHDGAARTIRQAIEMHGGEAERARNRFARLGARDREAVLSFVGKL